MKAKPHVTHLNLDDRVRVAAGVRAAQLRCSLTEYVAGLIREDAERAGITHLVASESEVARG